MTGVVFDLDGTLVDTLAVTPQVYVDTIRSLGGPRVPVQTVLDSWHIGSTPVVIERFLERELAGDELEVFYAHLDVALTSVQAFAGVPELLAELTHRNRPLGIFTSATRRAAEAMVAAAGISQHFAVLVSADDAVRPKPAADGLLEACRRLDVETPCAFYVGDAWVDLACARAAGVSGIHAAWGARSSLRPTACEWVADRPRDVPDLLGVAGARRLSEIS